MSNRTPENYILGKKDESDIMAFKPEDDSNEGLSENNAFPLKLPFAEGCREVCPWPKKPVPSFW